MINEYVIPENITNQLREEYIAIHEDGISDMLKYLRLYRYHTLRLSHLCDMILYYRRFEPGEVIDHGSDNDLFEQTVEAELRDLDEEYSEEALLKAKAEAVIEYLESKEAEK